MRKARNNPEWWIKAMSDAALKGFIECSGPDDVNMNHECEVMKEKAIYELRKVYWRNVFDKKEIENFIEIGRMKMM